MDSDIKKPISESIYKMVSGYARTAEIYTTVKLGIPDILAKGPKTLQEIANELDIDKKNIIRFLRLLVARELISLKDLNYSLTNLGDILRSDHPNSVRNLIIYIGEIQYRVGGEMLSSIQTGKPAFDRIFEMSFFDYLSKNPEMSSYFNEAMRYQASIRTEGLVRSYNFKQANTIIDIGGGDATLISSILENNPNLKGIVYEVSTVIEETQKNISFNNLSERCQVISGDFFKDPIPKGLDIYILSNIIHDWADNEAIKILNNCANSMENNNKLLLIEQIMPEVLAPGSSAIGSDMSMLVLSGGLERTLSEYRKMLSKVGLDIFQVIPLELSDTPEGRISDWAIIECKLQEK